MYTKRPVKGRATVTPSCIAAVASTLSKGKPLPDEPVGADFRPLFTQPLGTRTARRGTAADAPG